jgi:methionyl-tRNA formyltransferase
MKNEISKLRICFMGTPEIGATILNNLVEAGLRIEAVITQPDRPTGRGHQLKESPVKLVAKSYGIKVFEPKDKIELTEIINDLKPDLGIVAAFGMIIPDEAIIIPRFGMINFHPSLLPLYRGPSPITAPILNGDKETGVTIIQINEKMDAGDILNQEKIVLNGQETNPNLSIKLANLGTEMITKIIPKIESHDIKPKKQDNEAATYTKFIKKEDGKIKWETTTASEIERMSRAFQPWPGVYSYWNNKKIDFYDIKVGPNKNLKPGEITNIDNKIIIGAKKGTIVPQFLKIEGKNKVTPQNFICGHQDFIDSRLK